MAKPVDQFDFVDALIAEEEAPIPNGDSPTVAVELRQLRKVMAEVHRCADGLLVAIDLKHPCIVKNNWRRSLRSALRAMGEPL